MQSNPNTAEAGRRGGDVRSDCWVRLAPTDSGGIELDLKSKVESMYGDSIRALVADELAALGVGNAKVEIEDAGALPFVLMARVECAVRRLGVDVGNGYVPDFAVGTEYGTERERFRRSRLYLPGNEAKFMLNAGLHGPDGVILDLEDSVAASEKDAARLVVRNALRSVDFKGAERMVRINQGEMGLEDLDYIVPHNVHVVVIPKVESPEQVQQIDARIQDIQGAAGETCPDGIGSLRDDAESGNTGNNIFLMPIVESALGVIRAYEIAASSPNICALTIGLEDYTADIGTERTDDGRESFWARSQVVNAARAAGVQPIDSVFSDVSDMGGLRESVLEAKGLGFDGKGCIHPRQIAVVHEAFAPTQSELEQARRIVAAFEEAQEKGLAAVSLGSKMIDPPVVKRAQRVVRLAWTTRMVQ
ncbi:MAG: HpcH/HpaI aldolase/citrate lyase family protein [Planctomycetes bacterium]|nr:HpcH/HpaI aldolase/citrate lyase family protein [Planctomycetota bacterium]